MKVSWMKTELMSSMDGLMFRCRRFGDSVCDPEVREFAQVEAKASVDEETRLFPSADELRRLNEICRECPKGLFSIKKKECPTCGSREIEPLLIIIAEHDFSNTANAVFPYRCAACGKSLFSYREL